MTVVAAGNSRESGIDAVRKYSKSWYHQRESAYVGGVAEADTDRMEPELDNWSIVELIYLAAHGDEAVAALNLLYILLPWCLCGYFTQHCLHRLASGECKPHVEQGSERCEE